MNQPPLGGSRAHAVASINRCGLLAGDVYRYHGLHWVNLPGAVELPVQSCVLSTCDWSRGGARVVAHRDRPPPSPRAVVHSGSQYYYPSAMRVVTVPDGLGVLTCSQGAGRLGPRDGMGGGEEGTRGLLGTGCLGRGRGAHRVVASAGGSGSLWPTTAWVALRLQKHQAPPRQAQGAGLCAPLRERESSSLLLRALAYLCVDSPVQQGDGELKN